MRSSHGIPLAVIAIAMVAAGRAAAATVDGQLDLDYGAAIVTQTTRTSFVDANPIFSPNPTLYADGSELDVAYGIIDGAVLRLFLAGNQGFCCPTMFSHQEEFDVFIDSRSGGQHTLRADNANVGPGTGLNGMAGLTFDTGFDPDFWLASWVNMNCAYAELLTGGGGAGYGLGFNTSGAPGTLSGGTNPFGILAAVDNSNGAGVTAGCAAAGGAGVTTGVEWAIPLAAIGDPAGCVRVCVVIGNAPRARQSAARPGPGRDVRARSTGGRRPLGHRWRPVLHGVSRRHAGARRHLGTDEDDLPVIAALQRFRISPAAQLTKTVVVPTEPPWSGATT